VDVRYTKHAEERMVDRRITPAEVDHVLESPDIEYHDAKGNSVLVRFIGGRRIKVVVDVDTNPPIVITVAD
jgi:hypothetical protein